MRSQRPEDFVIDSRKAGILRTHDIVTGVILKSAKLPTSDFLAEVPSSHGRIMP